MRRTLPRRTLALVALLATSLLSPVASSSAQTEPPVPGLESSVVASDTGVPFDSSPEAGETGTAIEVAGADCLLPGADVPGEGVVVRLKSEGQVVAFTTLPVAEDGTWSGTLDVPAGTPVRQHWLQARCVYPIEPDPVRYATRSFTVTGEGPNAEADPPTPRFNGGIEPFGEYDGQSTCSPSAKPGMTAFMRMVLRNYGGSSLGISRACGIGGTSEHKEGRAWDWAMNSGSAAERASVERLFNWLFATDRQCNAYARARRLGMMYIIWNRRMFRMYDVARGWAPYSGASPHTEHVHFSLTRDGGAGRVSWYNPTYRPPGNWTPASRTVRDVDVSDQWDGIEPLSGDFDGDGLDDLLWYDPESGPAVVWFSLGDGRFQASQVAMGAGRIPLVGDWNGDCRSDIFWYGPGGVADRQWQGRANRSFRSVEATVNGTYQQQVVGDFNGDRVSDIYWYNPGAGEDRLWLGTQYGFVPRNANMGGNFEPFAGDFDGDFKSDIFWYGPGPAEDRLWYGNRSGFTPRDVDYAADRQPIPGDYNGDDRTDILWYGVGEVADRMWTGRSTRGFAGWDVTAERPYAFGAAADIDGDTFDDLFWHDSPAHGDRFWRY